MSFYIRGPFEWSMTRDAEGHREYNLVTLVESDDPDDGPAAALNTPGLPLPGSPWVLGNDIDFWAWCRWDATVEPLVKGEKNRRFYVKQKFGTKPLPREQQRGEPSGQNNNPVENPLLEPPKVSGSFVKEREEAWQDRFGRPITNSAFEQIRGAKVEFDISRQTIKIEQNLGSLNFTILRAYMNCVNDDVLWDLPRRMIKLSGCSWDRKFFQGQYVYYTRTLEFEIEPKGWDRILQDEATKVLSGKWSTTGPRTWIVDDIDGVPANPANPLHFMVLKDKKGDSTKFVLNGRGLPASVPILSAAYAATLGLYYVSLVGSNLNNALTNTAKWLPQIAADDQWDSTVIYPIGSVVLYAGVNYYIAISLNQSVIPPASAAWLYLPTGVTDKGDWLATTTYALGDIVRVPNPVPTGMGSVFVSKYDERSFPLLGIPLLF